MCKLTTVTFVTGLRPFCWCLGFVTDCRNDKPTRPQTCNLLNFSQFLVLLEPAGVCGWLENVGVGKGVSVSSAVIPKTAVGSLQ
jgi:hypothetical protein